MVACTYRADTGRTVEVNGLCCGMESQAVHQCSAKNVECIEYGRFPGLDSCSACTIGNRPPTFPTVAPLIHRNIAFPPKARAEGVFNCSIYGDEKPGFAFAFRSKWTDSIIRTCRLNEAGRTIGAMIPADTMHERAPRASEDPRLFKFKGRWHMAYTGFEKGKYFCSVLVAELHEWPMVSRVWYPNYDKRLNAEKNWGFFEHAGVLHAVYRIGPGEHRVLRFNRENVDHEYSTQWNPAWHWGEMRGGASPVMHNGEWYSWFHGFRKYGGEIAYTCGLYTFEDKPPFRPLRYIPSPVAIGGYTHTDDYGWKKSIYYPCGAAFKNGKWFVSAGEHDAKCTLAVFDADAIEKVLKPVRLKHFRVGEIPAILSLNGWCDENKAERISELVAGIPERVNGVEIGVFAGRSLFAAAAGVRSNPNGGKILGIDSYDAEENLKGVDTAEHRRHWPQHLVDEAKASMWAMRERLGLQPYCDVLVSTSVDAAIGIPHALNYLHIDGNHSTEGAVSDVDLYLPRVVVGGLVLVDDTHNGGKPQFLDGVMCAVAEVEKTCDLVEDHGTWRVYRKVR